jgi:hypothetical protein
LACRAIFEHEVVTIVTLILHIQHSDEVVVVPTSIFWWEFVILHLFNNRVWISKSFLLAHAEISNDLFKLLANKSNQLGFQRAKTLSLLIDSLNLPCNFFDRWLNWDVVKQLHICYLLG